MTLNNQKGFSLVELLIAIVIIGILAAVAVPQYNQYVAKSKESEAASVLGAIKKAQIDFRNMQKASIPVAASRTWRTAFDKVGYASGEDGTNMSSSWTFALDAATAWTGGNATATLKTGVSTADGRCTTYKIHYCWKESTPICTACNGTCDPDIITQDSTGNTDGTGCDTEDSE